MFFHAEKLGRCRNLLAHTDNFFNAPALHQLGHAAVEELGRLARLQDVREDECTAASLTVGAAGHEIECNVQRSQVAVVCVVDDGASVFALLHLEAHGHRL